MIHSRRRACCMNDLNTAHDLDEQQSKKSPRHCPELLSCGIYPRHLLLIVTGAFFGLGLLAISPLSFCDAAIRRRKFA